MNLWIGRVKKDEQLNSLMVGSCFQGLHDIVANYIKDGYHDEAFSAALHLLSNNIVTWAKTYNMNTEQFMEQAFEEISWMVDNVERRIKKKERT